MVKSIAFFFGFVAMLLVGIAGYLNEVSVNIIIFRGIFVFFVFYAVGLVLGVIIVKNTLEVLELKRISALALEKKDKEEKLKVKREELSKNIATGISQMMKE